MVYVLHFFNLISIQIIQTLHRNDHWRPFSIWWVSLKKLVRHSHWSTRLTKEWTKEPSEQYMIRWSKWPASRTRASTSSSPPSFYLALSITRWWKYFVSTMASGSQSRRVLATWCALSTTTVIVLPTPSEAFNVQRPALFCPYHLVIPTLLRRLYLYVFCTPAISSNKYIMTRKSVHNLSDNECERLLNNVIMNRMK